MSKDTINQKRRDILKTFAASGISKSIVTASPFVTGMLMARHAEAANGKIKRSVNIFIPGGAIDEYWRPKGSGSGMQLGKMSKGYESAKTKINFLAGMGHTNAGHGQMPQIFSGGWGQESFDVTMGKELGQGMPIDFLNLGVHSNGHGTMTNKGNSEVPFIDNPFNAFKLAFGSGNANPGKAELPYTKIMDAHAQAAKAIKSKLGSHEVHRMDEHLDSIADTRKRLEATAGSGGGGGSSSCGSAPNNTQFELNHANFTKQAKLQADIIASALKCNMTASCSLGFGNHQCEFAIPELNYKGVYHQSIHGGGGGSGYAHYTEMRSHMASLVAYLINKLDAEGILDDTIVVESTDMGHADQHSGSPVPYLLAGGSNAIKNGVVTTANGMNQRDVLHTAAKAAGVTLPYGKVIPGVLK